MSDIPPPTAEEAWRAANEQLRRVVELKDAEIAVLKVLLEEERAARRLLELRLAELERRLGMDSSNSSTPESKESIAAKARRKAERLTSQRERSKDRKPGGQKGRKGVGLTPAPKGERTEKTAEPPAECSGCGHDLAGARQVGADWAQVWDIPPITVEKTHWLLPTPACCGCGTTTRAAAPFGQAGSVVYGPNVNAAAIMLLALGDEAMKAALQGEDVLCVDETPVNVLRKNTDESGQPLPGQPHIVSVRTPDERLVWLKPIGARSKEAIKALGVLDGYAGYLVRDDYKGWAQFDEQLAGVQQCGAHMIRHLAGVRDLHPVEQGWAERVRTILLQALAAVGQAAADDRDRLDDDLLVGLRARYDHEVNWGEITNRHRDWHDGNHPGYRLARRLKVKAEQVWPFTTNFTVPFTNNASEQALKEPKRHQAVSGHWHTMATLSRYCRVRSYLVTTKGHGIRAIDAIP
ncbi:transposase [Streptosporangium sp. NBC_01810]|uniref:IS66 family transposase n=1 Tax=Streptosporangium sp. NBC_01810 TaxID=2975951 RepID=UPI002DDB5D5D|nr:transposase [Streptosporangium sp. NBC_01810]WSA22893.1 transposase [Streptosporangium sp. NBC_01810]